MGCRSRFPHSAIALTTFLCWWSTLSNRFGKRLGKKFRRIDKKTINVFQSYHWPGNVRELQNVIERAVILSEGDTFCVDETWLGAQAPRFIRPTVAMSGAL